MPRTKLTELEREFLYDRWKMFGSWLRTKRLMRGATQDEISKVVGVSRNQWIRYERGSKMFRKRMEVVARALNVPLETMLGRAGYKVSRRRNDVKGRLGKIGDMLFAGATDMAILELLRLNDKIAASRNGVMRRGGGLEATEFAEAVVLVNTLPAGLFELLLDAMQSRIKDKMNEPKMPPSDRNLIRKKCLEALQGNKCGVRDTEFRR